MAAADDLHQAVDASADRWTDELIALRRGLHEHPELAFEEHETARRVQEFLARLDIGCRTGIAGTGIVAMLEGARPGPTVALRADMDALPITEASGLPFVSKVPGKMHACGHDAHTAIALGVAAVLAESRSALSGRVMLIFQPGEETLSGARAMLEDGVFDGGAPNAILGFHNWPQLATGTVGWHAGAVMASSDAFDVTFRGVAAHGAHPNLGVDAIVGAAQFIDQLQTIVSREIAPMSPAVVTIGRIQGGTARNIIASSVEMNASVRTLEADVADRIEAAVRRILDGLRTGLRVDYELKWTKLTPALRNDPATMARVADVARAMLGAENVVEMPLSSMGSEDYAWFAERAPSAHLRIGSRVEGHDTAIHRPDFKLDERIIPLGTKLLSRAVLALMATR
jgi:amidohydrolase